MFHFQTRLILGAAMLAHIDDGSKKEEEAEQQEEGELRQQQQQGEVGRAEVDALQQAGLEDKVRGENAPTTDSV